MSGPPLALPPRPGEAPPAEISGGYGTPLKLGQPVVAPVRPGYPVRPEHHEGVRGLKGSWEWLALANQLPSLAVPFTNPPAGSIIYSGRCIVRGASIQNTDTAGHQFTLHNGMDASGVIVGDFGPPASSRNVYLLAAEGVLCDIGVFLVASAATMVGSVYLVPLEHYPFGPPGE